MTVKIALDANDALAGRLRPGMSVEPTIDTKAVRRNPPTRLSGDEQKPGTSG